MADPAIVDTSPENLRLTGLRRSAVEYRLHIGKTRPPRAARRCLCCGNEFKSDGPGNRMCDRCRRRAAEVSPYAPDIA